MFENFNFTPRKSRGNSFNAEGILRISIKKLRRLSSSPEVDLCKSVLVNNLSNGIIDVLDSNKPYGSTNRKRTVPPLGSSISNQDVDISNITRSSQKQTNRQRAVSSFKNRQKETYAIVDMLIESSRKRREEESENRRILLRDRISSFNTTGKYEHSLVNPANDKMGSGSSSGIMKIQKVPANQKSNYHDVKPTFRTVSFITVPPMRKSLSTGVENSNFHSISEKKFRSEPILSIKRVSQLKSAKSLTKAKCSDPMNFLKPQICDNRNLPHWQDDEK